MRELKRESRVSWDIVKERFKKFFDNLSDERKCDLIRIAINGRPKGKKLRDIMGLEKGAPGFDLDVIDGAAKESFLAELGIDKIEVKNDYEVSESQNIAIEFECNGRPSGIAISEAPWWCYVFNGAAYKGEVIVIIKKERLNRISQDSKVTNGGDRKASRIRLLNIFKLLRPLG